MKRIRLVLCLLLAIAVTAPAAAQQKTKTLNKELKAKVEKDSRKTAKKLEKEGWKTLPGQLPIAKMVQDSRLARIDTDVETGENLYFVGSHTAVGGNYTAAKQIADSRTRAELAQQISSKMVQIIEDRVVSMDYGDNDVSMVTDFISANKNVVEAQLTGIQPTLEIYREGAKNTTEVQVVNTINAERAIKDAKRAYVDAARARSAELATQLDALL